MKQVTKSVLLFVVLANAGNLTAQDIGKGTGLLIDRDRDAKIDLIDKPQGFGENLPKSVSLTKYAPSIGDQGDHGTCGGWSSTYYLATMEYAILKNTTDQVEIGALSYDPYYTYLMALEEETSVCDDGTYLDALCDVLYTKGVKRAEIDQVSCGEDISSVHNEANSILDFTSYDRLYDWLDTWEANTTAICYSLASKHPVLMGMYLPESFYYIGSDGVFNPTNAQRADPVGTSYGGHAMTIVGYDDEKLGGCFTVINSWGEDWGDDGYLYVRYEDFHAFAIAAYSFTTVLKNENNLNDCAYGDCNYGYGVQYIKGTGRFEGVFSGEDLQKGIYINKSGKLFKGGKLYMKKMVKKNYGSRLLYAKYDYKGKKPIGFILK